MLFTIGSNMLFVSVNSWVWFIAQNMCFTLSLAAIYSAMKKRGVLCLLFWACAVGCRPFTVLQLPVLCVLLMRSYDEGVGMFVRRLYIFTGALIMAILYMWLNYARFGNPIEFGHNYLPEFTRTKTGQFNLVYIKDNLYKLIRLSGVNENGSISIQIFDGTNMFIASPVFLVTLYYLFKDIKRDTALKIMAFVLMLAELLCITAHKTMGGWGFGNRYTNDIMPLALVILALSYKNQRVSKPLIILTLYSTVFNTVGTVLTYLKVI